MIDADYDVVFDQGVEAAYGASYLPRMSEWRSPYLDGSPEDKAWSNGFRHQYQKDNH